MDNVIVSGIQFYSHFPRKIPKGTVNAEAVIIRLDSEWDNLTVRIHWLNVASGVEKVVLLDRDQPNTIPWEVLTDLGELRMGLDGMDSGTIVKPTVWLTYGYVVDGVDPESGSDPQPPTPSWEQQMVEQATQANQAAQAAQNASEEAAKSAASAGPYAQAAKASQDAAATSAQQANEAAQTAQDAVGSIGDSVDRAEGAATEAGTAKQAAETAQAAASNSAGTAQGAATTASEAAKTAQEAATQAGEYLATVKQDANDAESAALEAGKSQEAAQGAAQTAANARDQATTAANTAQGHATAARTAKDAAEQAAATAGSAQSGAAQSAQASANSAKDSEAAKQEAQKAASIFPQITQEDAGKFLAADLDGKRLVFVDRPGGGGDDGNFEDVAEMTTEAPTKIVNIELPFPLDACRVSVTIPAESSSINRNLYVGETVSATNSLCRTQAYGSSTTLETVYEFLVLKKHDRWLAMSIVRGGTPSYKQVQIYTISNGLCLLDASTPLESLSVFTYSNDMPAGTKISVEGVHHGS